MRRTSAAARAISVLIVAASCTACQNSPAPASHTSFRPMAAATAAAPLPPLPGTLSGAQANAIVDSASRAQRAARFSGDPQYDHVTIAPKYWPEELQRLHPLRVWQDRGNIVIVLAENVSGEEGWYVQPGISNYIPTDDSPAILEPMLLAPESRPTFARDSFPDDAQLNASRHTWDSPQGRAINVSTLYRYHCPHKWGP